MGDKDTFPQRLAALRLNPDAIEEIRVHVPEEEKPYVIPNGPKTQGSLQIWASATDRDGHVSPSSAAGTMHIYGKDYTEEAREHPGMHPNIDLMDKLSASKRKWRVDVIRRNEFKAIPEHVRDAITQIQKDYDTFYVYDKSGITNTARRFNDAFSWTNFTNFFAVKALPNPFALEILQPMGFGVDCSSAPELRLGERTGYHGARKIFTSNNTRARDFRLARDLDSIVNLDDITFIEKLRRAVGTERFPEMLCFRWNPGPLREGSEIIGNPEEAKYGLTNEQIFEGYRIARDMGVKRFGLHKMIVSNMLIEQYIIETGRMAFELEAKISRDLGIPFDFIDIGGGVGLPYRPEQREVDLVKVSEGLRKEYYEAGLGKNGNSPRVVMECGRAITGPNGWLNSRVINVMKKYRRFVGLDTSINNLLRAGIYSQSYHHITVFGKEHLPQTEVYDLVGSLCEGNDKLGINRTLPIVSEGDLVTIHDAGAHGSAMRNRYNAQLGCAAFLVNDDGSFEMIERGETEKDLFATFDFPGSKYADLAK